MDAKSSEKRPDNNTERRKSLRPRRRLVDLTLMAGTDRREKKERRKTDLDLATERKRRRMKEMKIEPVDGETERLREEKQKLEQ